MLCIGFAVPESCISHTMHVLRAAAMCFLGAACIQSPRARLCSDKIDLLASWDGYSKQPRCPLVQQMLHQCLTN